MQTATNHVTQSLINQIQNDIIKKNRELKKNSKTKKIAINIFFIK